MIEPIFKNEKELRIFMTRCVPTGISEKYMEITVEHAKEKGYIKKSIVEEAEEIIARMNRKNDMMSLNWHDYVIFKNAIQHLKKQLSEK